MNIIAVIPAYNEQGRIAASVADALPYVQGVVVVDDCSADATGAEAFAAGAHVLRHVINRGQGAALQTGTQYALEDLRADAIVHFDADGQMRGDEIPKMVEPIASGEVDVVLGSRFLGIKANMPATRWLTLRAALVFTMLVSGIRVTDTHNGFRAFSADAAAKVRITMNRMAHASEILDLIKVNNLAYVERPVSIRYSEETLAKGQSFLGSFAILRDYFKGKFFDEA